MPDLMYLLNSLTDAEGRIKVPGIYDEVLPLTHEERKVYEGIEFDVVRVEGAHWSSGDKAVIPARVVGKFSIRTVPNQKVQKVRECVEKHLQEQFTRRGSPNQVNSTVLSHGITIGMGTQSLGQVRFTCARAVTVRVPERRLTYGVVPEKTRGGFTVGPAKLMQDYVCRDVLVMSINPPGCGFHSQNENVRVADLVSGVRTLLSPLVRLASL
ncbi:hypothetical protein HPB50_025984 [Hyalomma asiaticum]|uniref:Uncharacterized protein n=1 Tax=Hyalomma asiaticum TaxID=266040 RepID=A0ACB7STE4_HYAAI|nr:hypothetical protein HPB50_025984 [Hyalomma asiaticum]